MKKLIKKILSKYHGFQSILRFDNWIQLIINRTFFSETGSVIHRINGMEILIDYNAGEQNGTRSCVGDRSYECFLKDNRLKNKKLSIMDLGANGGGFCLLLNVLGLNVDKVIAVELNPFTHSRLFYNLTRNLRGEFKIIQGAVGADDCKIVISHGIGSISDSIFDTTQDDDSNRKEVSSYCFDTIFKMMWKENETVDICKIDIEGAEHLLFNMGKCKLIQRCERLIIEVHDEEKEEEFDLKIKSFGFVKSCIRSQHESNVFLYENEKLLNKK